MKPLERRFWYLLLSFGVSALIVLGLWKLAALPLNLSVGTIFVFATIGVSQAVNRLLALLLIKIKPSLGAVQ